MASAFTGIDEWKSPSPFRQGESNLVDRSKKTTTTSTPKGSVSASGWLSWPKLCWTNVLCIICTCLIAASGGAFAYFSHVSDGLLPSVVVPVSAAPGFEHHAGFCDLNGGKCQEEYRGFGESAELCEQRCLEFPAGARACTAVEYWYLSKRLPMCKLFTCEGDITRALKAPANNVECLVKTESSNVALRSSFGGAGGGASPSPPPPPPPPPAPPPPPPPPP